MTFNDWKLVRHASVGAIENLNEELKKLEDALGTVHSTSPGGLFTTLSQYMRSCFTYKTSASTTLKIAIESKSLNCDEAAEVMIALWLLRNTGGGSAKVVDVQGASVPVLTPPMDQPGMKITKNVTDGNRRMIFNSGHRVAQIEGAEYDIIGGLSGSVSAQYIKLEKIAKTDDFTCDIGATKHVFKKGWFSTDNGLSKFTAKPKVTA